MRTYVPLAAGAATLALGVAGVLGAPVALAADATLSVDGQPTKVKVFNDTVGSVLKENGITVGEHDVVAPALSDKVSKGSEITVRYGRQVTVVVDGVPQTRWVTATTVDEALVLFGVPADGAQVSLSRSASIGREGTSVSVTTPNDVTLTADGQTTPIAAFGTVADLLAAQGVTLAAADTVSPAATTALADGMAVKVVRVVTKQVTKEVPVAFTETTTDDATLAKGTTKVKTEGVAGVSTETWTQTFNDGQLAAEEKSSSIVSKQPVNKVTLVGTKVATTATTTAKSSTASGSTPAKSTSTGSTSTGSTSSGSSTGSSSGGSTTPVSGGAGTGPADGAAAGNSCGASFYDEPQMTATGEVFNPNAYTAAHKTLPFGSKVKVTNPSTGQSVVVRINDRGPYISGRCLDLSRASFAAIAPLSAGHITVTWQVVG